MLCQLSVSLKHSLHKSYIKFESHASDKVSKYVPGHISGCDKDNYRLLCGAFRQCVSVAQIIDFDILNIIPVCNIHVSIDVARARTRYARR